MRVGGNEIRIHRLIHILKAIREWQGKHYCITVAERQLRFHSSKRHI